MKMSIDQKIEKVLPFLNEKQQRIYLASEAEYLGFGGVTAISKASGISRPTIILGKKEINERVIEFPHDRIRKKGGGRKRVFDKQPRLVNYCLDKLIF